MMNPQQFTYPPMPQGIDEKVIQPSKAFKNEVLKVAAAIVLFLMVYLALMAAAFGFAALCGLAGFALVTFKPSFFTLMIGLGLAGLGLMVVFFLLKFVFKRNKTDRSGLTEITENEQPELFAFVRKLTAETQTPFPKRIYLSPDVNASVFYDSSFWSMFLPIRKNLVIGLGLVNCVNISEFKAVLAHEFGHFSQRSMKLGSFVYNVNKIIHNLLYENDGYEKTLEKWANMSGYFAFFASTTVAVVRLMQKILQKVYGVVNKNYYSLSRQMEFHADAVSAYVSGADHLVSSLNRLEAAEICYQRLISHYNEWLPKNLIPDNLYPHHTELMQHFATHFKIPYQHGLLQVNGASMALFNQSRLVIKDQWASHPSTEDREQHLNSLNIHTESLHIPAWSVFQNAEALQQQFTADLYKDITISEAPEILDLEAFKELYYREFEEGNFNPAYQGYYNDHTIAPFNLEEALQESTEATSLEELFSPENASLPGRLSAMESDAETVQAIMNGNTGIKTFDFDGQKYTIASIYDINDQLTAEISAAKRQLAQHDQRVFRYFYQQAASQGNGESLKQAYRHLFQVALETEQDLALYNNLITEIQGIYQDNLPIESAHHIISQVNLHEVPFKARIKEMLADETFAPVISALQRENLEAYLANEQVYFDEPNFHPGAIALFNEGMNAFAAVVLNRNFMTKKAFLSAQLELAQAATPAVRPAVYAEVTAETV